MDLPFEVLVIMFSYLTLNDTMEASAACKLFYHTSSKNKLFVKKLDDSRKLFTCNKLIFNSQYGDICVSFSNQLFIYLEKYVKEDNFYLVKDTLMDRLYYSVHLSCVWNHLFLCERLNSVESMCGYCTKLCIKNKKISDHINNNLFVHIGDFPCQFKQGFTLTHKVTLFVHTNVVIKNDRLCFGGLYYESIDSPIVLWKLYLDILSWIVFNVSYKFIFPLLMSGIDMNSCTNFTICTYKNCLGLKLKSSGNW